MTKFKVTINVDKTLFDILSRLHTMNSIVQCTEGKKGPVTWKCFVKIVYI